MSKETWGITKFSASHDKSLEIHETIVPGAGDYHFLLERVTSLGEL